MKNYLAFILSLFLIANCLGQNNNITQNSDIFSEGCTNTEYGFATTKSIKVGNYLYVGYSFYSTILTYDISDPTSPTNIHELNLDVGEYSSSINDIKYANGYIYATGRSDKFFVIDISNPSAPSLSGETTEIFNSGGDMVVSGNYAYVINTWNSSLDVIDISDPTNPNRVGQYMASNYPFGISYKDGYVYYIADDIYVIDVSNPTTPVLANTINTPSNSAYKGLVIGDKLYTSTTTDTITFYDISTASTPVYNSEVIIPSITSIKDLRTDFKYLYTACNTNSAAGAVSVLDLTSGASPIPIYQSSSSTHALNSVVPSDGYLYTVGNDGGDPDSDRICTYSVPQFTCGNNQTLTPAATEVCTGTSTTINTGASEMGANYYLRNAATNEIISGPVAGTGSAISLNTGIISNPTDYKVSLTKEHALNFNGTTEQVTVPNNSAFEFSTGTVECWIKPTANGINKSYISMRTNGATSRYSLHLNEGSNTLGLYSNSTGYNTISYSISPNVWYHIAMVMKSSNTDVYVNGAYAGTINGTIDASKTGYPFVIGSPNDINYTGENFIGDIDEVRVWNTERTASQIADNYNTCLTGSEAGLVAFYPIGNGEGSSIVTDLSSNGFDGALTNMDPNTDWVNGEADCGDCNFHIENTATVTTGSIDPHGARGNMLTFNGTNYVNIPMNSSLQFGTGDFAIESWIKTTTTGFEVFVGNGTYFLAVENGLARFDISGGLPLLSSTLVNDGEWHHIAGVRVGGNMQVFVDGVFENTSTNTSNASPIPDLAIGKPGGFNSLNFNGSIDEVRIWNTSRTQSEIRANKHLSLDGFCEPNLVGNYKFNETSGMLAEDLSLFENDGTHMNSPTIAPSEVQVAAGFATAHTITSAGITYSSLSTVDGHTLDLEFSSVHPNGEVIVTFLDELPQGGAPAGAHGNYRNESWIIDNYGATTTGLDGTVTFNYPDGLVTDMTLTNYKLHKRPSNSTGAWSENNVVASAVGTTSGNNFISYDGISSFSIFFPSAFVSVLPIELIYFDAKLKDEIVTLNWGTASEKDNDFFTVEKSKDGINWEEVIRIAGAGNSATVLNYTTKDQTPYEGVSYYRLKQTDSDGRTSYSENRTVNLISLNNEPIIFPNPSKGIFNVKLNPNYIGGVIEINNFYGGNILKKTIENDTEEINLDDFSNGVYLIFISNKNLKYTDRIIISK